MPAGKMVLATRATRTPTYRKKRYVTKKQMYKAIHANIENKLIFDRMITNFSAVPGTWVEASTMLVPQGTGANQRIGNQIRIKSIEINGVIAEGSSLTPADDVYNVMRVVIALWSGSTVTTPLQSAAVAMDSVIRKTNAPQGLLKKYYDKYIPLTITSSFNDPNQGFAPSLRKFKYFKIFKKGITIDFGAANTLTPNKRLQIAMISDSLLVTHPGFITGYWCVSYEDA